MFDRDNTASIMYKRSFILTRKVNFMIDLKLCPCKYQRKSLMAYVESIINMTACLKIFSIKVLGSFGCHSFETLKCPKFNSGPEISCMFLL